MPSEADPEHGDANFSSDQPVPTKLVKFRDLTGINTPKRLLDAGFARPAKNIGIYARVVTEEYRTGWQYWIMNSVIEATFLGQIAIGAALTALGAADSSHIAITVLGSANTVIAGVQTYLKGQGLPNRLQQYEFGLRKLREHIEDLERHFSHEDCKLNVDHEIAEVAAMYHAVRQTAEDNTPDTYLPMAGAGAKLLAKAKEAKGNISPAPPAPPAPGAPANASAAPITAAETAPEALAPSGKPPTADEVAEAGGPEASKPAPPAADKDAKKDDATKDATVDKDSKKANTADKPAEAEAANGEASASGGHPVGETQDSGPNADHPDATEETPLLKK